METAKGFFLEYSQNEILDRTPFGDILSKGVVPRVYVNGMHVADDEGLTFSYNITKPTKALKSALNRERTNVGRSAYKERVEKILSASKSKNVVAELGARFTDTDGEHSDGGDELKWSGAALGVVKALVEDNPDDVVVVTVSEMEKNPDEIATARESGKKIAVVPKELKKKIDKALPAATTMSSYKRKEHAGYDLKFVPPEELSENERNIFDMTDDIFLVIGGRPGNVVDVKVSEDISNSFVGSGNTLGLWCPADGRIVVRRDALESFGRYAGVLLHETAHATSGAGDRTRDFENELTRLTGELETRFFELFSAASAGKRIRSENRERVKLLERVENVFRRKKVSDEADSSSS